MIRKMTCITCNEIKHEEIHSSFYNKKICKRCMESLISKKCKSCENSSNDCFLTIKSVSKSGTVFCDKYIKKGKQIKINKKYINLTTEERRFNVIDLLSDSKINHDTKENIIHICIFENKFDSLIIIGDAKFEEIIDIDESIFNYFVENEFIEENLICPFCKGKHLHQMNKQNLYSFSNPNPFCPFKDMTFPNEEIADWAYKAICKLGNNDV
ncbi:MAG: hypothetical protein GY870_05775 [archaeon]|nr:hypothetical protein [archaeon]